MAALNRESKSLLWFSTIALVLGGVSLAVAFLRVGGHGTESGFVFLVLLSIFLTTASAGFAVALARRHGVAWLLVGLSAVLGCLAFFSMGFV